MLFRMNVSTAFSSLQKLLCMLFYFILKHCDVDVIPSSHKRKLRLSGIKGFA